MLFLIGCATTTPQNSEIEEVLQSRMLDEWSTIIEPSASARAWQLIPWYPDLLSGAQAAAKTQKPLLLWLMNGHPLGCT